MFRSISSVHLLAHPHLFSLQPHLHKKHTKPGYCAKKNNRAFVRFLVSMKSLDHPPFDVHSITSSHLRKLPSSCDSKCREVPTQAQRKTESHANIRSVTQARWDTKKNTHETQCNTHKNTKTTLPTVILEFLGLES